MTWAGVRTAMMRLGGLAVITCAAGRTGMTRPGGRAAMTSAGDLRLLACGKVRTVMTCSDGLRTGYLMRTLGHVYGGNLVRTCGGKWPEKATGCLCVAKFLLHLG